MTTAPTRTQRAQTPTRSTPSPGGGTVARGTLGWYGDASGGFFLKTLDEWNPRVACVPGLSKSHVQFAHRPP